MKSKAVDKVPAFVAEYSLKQGVKLHVRRIQKLQAEVSYLRTVCVELQFNASEAFSSDGIKGYSFESYPKKAYQELIAKAIRQRHAWMCKKTKVRQRILFEEETRFLRECYANFKHSTGLPCSRRTKAVIRKAFISR